MKRRIISLVLLCSLLLQLCSTPAMAVDVRAGVEIDGEESSVGDMGTVSAALSGEYDGLLWALEEGVLRLSGQGEMPTFLEWIPWADYADDITSVVVEEGITSVSDYAFYGCSALTSVSLPCGLKKVGIKAFGATAITELVIPETVTEFVPDAVADCAALTDLYFHGDNPLTSTTGIPAGVQINHAMNRGENWGATGLATFYSYGGHRYSFWEGAYDSYSAAASEVKRLGGGVLAISSQAEQLFVHSFVRYLYEPVWLGAAYDPELEEWSWDNGEPWSSSFCQQQLPEGSFTAYSRLMMEWDGSWQLVTNNTMPSMIIVEFPDYEAPEEMLWSFDETTGQLLICGEGEMPEYEPDVDDSGHPVTGAPWAEYITEIKSLVIDSGITSVSEAAFCGCWYLTDVTLPEGLTSIGMWAFAGYSGLTQVDLSGTAVKTIGDYAFHWQSDVTAILLPATLESVGEYAFTGCGVTSLVFPASLTEMDSTAFDGCSELKNVYFCGDRPFENDASGTEGLVFHCKETTDAWASFTWNGEEISAVEFPSYNGHQYLYVDGVYTYSQADMMARMMGGFLATSIDEEENSWLVSLLPENSGLAWLGAACNGGTWSWTNDEPFSYSNWADGVVAQDGHGGALGADGLWYSRLQDTRNPVLVEFLTRVPAVTGTVNYDVPGGQLVFDRATGTITGYTGQPTAVVVPEKIDGIPVTAIADGAMKGDGKLSSMDLSATAITTIGADVFDSCGDLIRLVLPESIASVDVDALTSCNKLCHVVFQSDAPAILNQSSLNTSLSIWYPKGAGGWTELSLSQAKPFVYVEVGGNTLLFDESTSLIVGYLGQPVEVAIPAYAAGAQVAGIGPFAFESCLSLETISVPDGMATLGASAFHNCEYLQTIDLSRTALTLLDEKVFHNCLRIESIQLPEGITSIGMFCFNDCNALTELEIPSTVTTIHEGAFYKCTALTELVFPAALTMLSGYAIPYCDSLKLVDLSRTGITQLYAQTFVECPALEEIYLPDTLTNVNAAAFTGCTGVKGLYFMGNAPTATGDMSAYLPNATAYYEPDATGWGAAWYGLATMQDPAWVLHEIDGGHLIFNVRTAEIVGYVGVPEGIVVPAVIEGVPVTGIADQAFASCLTLIVVDLSATAITSIGPDVFDGCTNLVRLTLPATVTAVDMEALTNCTSLHHIVFTGNAPAIDLTGDYDLPADYTIWYPADGEGWEDLGTLSFIEDFTPVEIPGGVMVYDEANTRIVGYYGDPTELTIPEGVTVTELAPSAFSCCQSLRTVTLPETVSTLGMRAFEKCGNLLSVDLSAIAETQLRDEMFRDCVKVETILLPHSLRTIGFYPFNDCNVLKELTFPDTLTAIGPGAFYKCYELTELTFPEALATVYAEAFTNCTSMEKLTFSGNAPEVYTLYTSTENMATFIPDAVVYYMAHTEGWSDPFSGLKAISYPNPNLVDYEVDGGTLIFNKKTGVIIGYEGEPTGIVLPAAIEDVAVTGFAAGALAGCVSLIFADLSATWITTLPDGLFRGCTALTDVVLPPALTVFSGEFFEDCVGLERVMFTGPAPKTIDVSVLDLPIENPNAVIYFPEENADGWSTPKWNGISAYPYTSREGYISWPYPGGTLFLNGETGMIVGGSIYQNHVLIPETVRGIKVKGFTSDAFVSCDDLVRMFFLGKVPEDCDLTSCPADMTIYYPVAEEVDWGKTFAGFTTRPYSPAADLVSHEVTGGAILLDPANGLISGYTGSPTQVLVPASVGDISVTGIRGDAFDGGAGLSLLILPTSVATVERDAFDDLNVTIYGPEALGFTPLKITSVDPGNAATVGGYNFTMTVTTNIPYALPLTVTNGQITAFSNGVYTFRVDLSGMEVGEYNYTFEVKSADYGLFDEVTYFVDRKPPTAPGNFRAEAGVLANTLYWEAPPEANVVKYWIYINTSGSTYSRIAVVEGKSSLTYTHTGLTAGEQYTYAVVAVDVYGQDSVLSDPASATPVPDTVAPEITGVSPQNGSILTGTVSFTIEAQDNIGLASITLEVSVDEGEEKEWTALAFKAFTDVTGGTAVFSLDTTAYDDTKPLYVRLSARDIYGNKGFGSTIFTYALDNTPPEKVTGLRAEATTTVITLNWSNVAAQDFKEFRVEQQQKDGSWSQVRSTGVALGVQITGLTPGTEYSFRVRAVDKQGNLGQYSEPLTVSTLADTYPPVITAITPAPGYFNGTISMRFTAHDDFGVASYQVQVSYDGKEWISVGDPVETADTFLNYPLDTTPFDEGDLFVRAIVTDRYGNVSNTGNDAPCNQYIIDRTAPAVPAGVAITSGDGYLAVTWEKGGEEDLNTYTVWRSATGEEGTFTALSRGLQQLYWRDSAVEYGKTYYYYVTVRDFAGNESRPSAVVSGVPQDDSQPPQVVSVSPSDGYVLSSTTAIRVRLYDNNKVTGLCWQVDGGETQSVEVSITDGVVTLPLDLASMGSVDFTLAVWCVDAVGRESTAVTRKYSIDLTPPAYTEIAAESADLAVNIFWNGVDDADLAGYQVYRSVNGGSWTWLLQRSAGQSNYSYTDTNVTVGNTYAYRVHTVDIHGNIAKSSSSERVQPIDRDILPPSAILDGATSGTVNMEMAFSAKRSSDNKGIASYLWDFGDNSQPSYLMEPVHMYTAPGSYTVTLTVTDTSGNSTIASYQVTVKEPSAMGRLTVTVEDENGTPLSGAGVYLDLGADDQSIVYTNGSGQVTVSLPAGSHNIGAYTDGYLPASETVNITAGVESSLRLVAVHQELVVGELTVERMTLEEIRAAGIDTSDPANQQVFQFTIQLTYGNYEAYIETIYNSEGEVLKDPEPVRIVDSNDEERELEIIVVPTGTGDDYVGDVGSGSWGGDGPDTPLVVIMDIPGQASWLKDFFEVRLTVINQAETKFALDNCTAVLNMVDGLTLMDTAFTSADPVRDMGTIYGQSSATATWIIRGDKGGDYNLSADFTGVLRDFDRTITARFETANPFHVREGDGLTLEVVVENAILADADGAIRVGLRNDDPDPYYLPNITLDPELVTRIDTFKTAGNVTLDTGLEVLNTGETIWWDYIVPRESWDVLFEHQGEDFYLIDAMVKATGGVELPWTIEEVLPFTIGPDLIEVSRLYSNGAESDISYVNIGKDTLVGGKIPALRIRTYRLNPITGEYEPCSMEITIKDEYKMDKKLVDENNGITVTTDENGVYDLEAYEILSVNNDKTYTIRISARRAQAVEIPVVLRGETAEVGRLDVYVYTEDENGEITPLEGATVTITGHDLSGTSDDKGLADFRYVDQGYQEIVISMDGYLPITDLIQVGEDSEFSYRLTVDDDPGASRVISITNDLTQWTEGNQTIFPEGRVTGNVQFKLERRVAEGETFRKYHYRIVRDGAAVETGTFTAGDGFRLDLATLKAGDKVQFAVETVDGRDFLHISPFMDSNIVVASVPSALGDLIYSVPDLLHGGTVDLTEKFKFDPETFIEELSVTSLAGGIETKEDEDGKQQALIDQVNRYTMTRSTTTQDFPIQAKYELSGKFTLSVIVGSSTEYTDSTGINVRRGVRTEKGNTTTFKGFTAFKDTDSESYGVSGQFRLDFILQYNPARDEWDLSVIGTIDAGQSFTLVKIPFLKVGTLSLGLSLKESASLSLYKESVGPANQTEILGNGAVFDKVGVGGELKGAVGAKLFSEKLASGDVYLKVGLDFEFLPDWILSASATLGVEGNFLIWKANKDILSDTWVLAPDAEEINLMALYSQTEGGMVLAEGQAVESLGTGETLMSDVFDDAAPQLALLPDGKILMVWCGYTGDEKAPVALFWAVYDGQSWTAPTRVDSDGTADLYPTLVSHEGQIHLVWVDFAEAIPDGMDTMTVEEIQNYAFSRLGVSIAAFTEGGWNSTQLYEGGRIVVAPQVAVSPDGRVMVAWISNEANLQSATAEAPDCVRWMLLEGGAVTGEGSVNAPGVSIADLALGFSNGFRMGLLADTPDGRTRVHHSRYSAGGWMEPAEVGVLTGEDSALTMSPDGDLYFLNSGRLYCYEDGHLVHLLRHELVTEDAALLTWAETERGSALLWTATVDSSNVLCMVSVNEDGTVGVPTVVMTSDEGTLSTPAAVLNGDRLMILATHCRDTDAGWQQDLVCLDRAVGVDLSLTADQVFHSGFLIPGVAMETMVTAESLGLTTPGSFTAAIVTADGTQIASAEGGSSLNATIQWTVPDTYSAETLYVTVTAAGDVDSGNNRVEMTNVIRDLALSNLTYVGRMDGVEIFTIRVTNLGLTASPAATMTVTLLQQSAARDALPVVEVPALASGASVDLRVELTLDRAVDQPLAFRLNGTDGDPTNDVVGCTLYPVADMQQEKETVVSFDGWEQTGGTASAAWKIDNRNGETGTFTVMVASYDEFGQMVSCDYVTLQVEGGTERTISASIAEGHTVRAYLMDGSWAPLDSAKTLGE